MISPKTGVTTGSLDKKAMPSVFDVAPEDLGGIYARLGFAYQDDVAAGFYLQMLSSVDLIEVSCETYDDILLVWQEPGNTILEFVQVKAEHPDQLWTIAKLCERTKSPKYLDGKGTSILEKSLNRDQYIEPALFRIVTCRQIDSELTVLTRVRGHEHRSKTYIPFNNLVSKVLTRLDGVKSKNENDSVFWLTNACWDVASEHDIVRLNQQSLANVLHSLGLPYDPDTVRGIYDNLRMLAKETAEFGVEHWKQKRISRDQLLAKLKSWIDPYPDKGKVERLEQKLKDAGLDDTCRNVARDQQRHYLQKRRTAGYFTFEQAEDVEHLVLDKLHTLRSSLDTGKIKANGEKFHDICLNEVKGLQQADIGSSSPFITSYLTGCMYEITARCRHRFTRFQS
jgi:Cap4 dsDNA endonuclease